MSKPLLQKLTESLNSGELFSIVDECLACVQVQKRLGFSGKGQYVSVVRTFLETNEIDISHFTTNGLPKARRVEKICLSCSNKFTTEARPSNEQVTCSRACSNTYFRSGVNNGNYTDSHSNYRKKALAYYGCFCSKCGFENLLALEVHHKDRDRQNNSIDNLIVLCANCHLIEHNGVKEQKIQT